MRIPCAVCNYPHNSTVTPFMHDIVPPTEHSPTGPNNLRYAKAVNGAFKCEKCGANLDPCEYCECQPRLKPRWTGKKSKPTEKGDYWVICGRGIVALAYWNGKKWILKEKKYSNKPVSFWFKEKRIGL